MDKRLIVLVALTLSLGCLPPHDISQYKQQRDVEKLISLVEFSGTGLSMDVVNREICTSAALALGELQEPRAIEPIFAAVRDDRVSSKAAGTALAMIGTPAVDPAIKALEDEDEGVRASAAFALGELREPRAIEPIFTAVRNDRMSSVSAGRTLAKIGTPAVDPVANALEDKDESVRQAAVNALQVMLQVETLIAALKYKNAGVRAHAAFALGEAGDRRAIEPLIAALKDEDRRVRAHAASALGGRYIRDRRVVQPLIDALRDEDSKVRDAAYWTLRSITKKDFGKDYRKWQEWWE